MARSEITILFVGVNPDDTAMLDLTREAETIQRQLHQSEHRERFQLEQRWNAEVTQLPGLLLRYTPQVLHFGGHGTDDGRLYFRGAEAGTREVERLYLDMIASACSYLYLENQYFTSASVAEALRGRLARADAPEIVLVTRLSSHGWLEEATMHVLRTRLIQRLKKADRHGRFHVYYPHIPGLAASCCLDVHSKMMVVDDKQLRIGSANLCNRSMGMDTECDVLIESRGEHRIAAVIRQFRDGLIAEHLGVPAARLRETLAGAASLHQAIAALRSDGRTLRELDSTKEWPEALVSIDVNTGRYTGKKDPEKTILRTNLEAAREIARQIRLRDIGGIIVCDFIDMDAQANRDRVLQELRQALGRDRARTKAYTMSELGLVEMTRQRVRQSHLQSMTEPCQVCHGTGRVFTPETIIRRMERSVRRMAVEGKRDHLVVRLHPDVAMYVLEQEPDIVKKLEKSVGFSLELRDDPLLGPDEFKLVVKGAGRDVTQQYAVA